MKDTALVRRAKAELAKEQENHKILQVKEILRQLGQLKDMIKDLEAQIDEVE